MTSRAERKRRKKRALQGRKGQQGTNTPKMAHSRPSTPETARPTPERMARGKWAEPKGEYKDAAIVDLASDMIGQLYYSKQITTSQEQAARLFQELRAGYLAELGTKGYGSCLADNQSGYDASDGDPAAIKAYRNLETRIGRIKTACLILECDRGASEEPVSLIALRRALDAVAA